MIPLPRSALALALLAMAGLGGWHAYELSAGPGELTRLYVGERVELPQTMAGRCLHLVAFHGSCGLCRSVVADRETALWLTYERHPGNRDYPNVLVSRRLWELMKIKSIPTELVIRADGIVRYRSSPLYKEGEPPGCV